MFEKKTRNRGEKQQVKKSVAGMKHDHAEKTHVVVADIHLPRNGPRKFISGRSKRGSIPIHRSARTTCEVTESAQQKGR